MRCISFCRFSIVPCQNNLVEWAAVHPGAEGFESPSRQVRLLLAHGAKPGFERKDIMTKETVQITEDIKEAEESGIEIEYYTLDGKKPVLHMAPGDLMIICNVLHDYAQMLSESAAINIGYAQASYIYHADRCRKIQAKIESQMGYSTEAAIEKCEKKHKYYGQEPLVKDNDIGEDALVLAMRQRNRKKNEEKQRKEFEDTGLRPGELFALERSDINLDKCYIDVNKTLVYQKYLTDQCKTFHVEPPKTKYSYRKVPINSVCKIYLERQFELKKVIEHKRPKQQNNYLFVTKYNTPLNSQIYSDAIRAVIRNINLLRTTENEFPTFSGHTLRHTFATRCFEQGISPKIVQSYLGHTSLKMTMDLYTHVTEEKASNEIEKITMSDNNNIIDFRAKIC